MRLRHLLATVAVAVPLTLGAVMLPAHAHALIGDPVVTVDAPRTVAAGTPITFTLTIDQDGYAPTNGTQKITWRNPRTFATMNVANYTVIPMRYADGVWTFTYRPGLAEVGRSETFSVAVPVSNAYNARKLTAAASFTVVVPVV